MAQNLLMYIQKTVYTPFPLIGRSHCYVLAFKYKFPIGIVIVICIIFSSYHMNLEQGLFVKAHLKARAVGKEGFRTLGVVEGAVAHAAPWCSDGQVPTVEMIS